ncbi:MAG TPA: HAD-IB family hydrolase [Cellulomonas sp.]
MTDRETEHTEHTDRAEPTQRRRPADHAGPTDDAAPRTMASGPDRRSPRPPDPRPLDPADARPTSADPEDPPADPAGRPAAFFDLDKTVIASSTAAVFARPLLAGGVLTRRAMLGSARSLIAFLLGSATEDRTERLRTQLSRTIVGWDVGRVAAIVAESLPRTVERVLYQEAVDLVTRHHAAGADVVVVSASSEELVRPVAELIGADEVIASRLEVQDGRYTGRIAFYAYGPAKATAMRELAGRRGYDLAASSAYSDSATDAPMLDAVGHGTVVNPGPALRALAAERGWSTVVFRHRAGGQVAGARGLLRTTVVVAAGATVVVGATVAIAAARAGRRGCGRRTVIV